ncbi:MAG: ATP-binding protein [Phyllobacterium sp.]
MKNDNTRAVDTADHAIRPFHRNRTEGHVIRCDGERAVIAAKGGASISASDDYWAVGQLISIKVGESRIVGLVYSVDVPEHHWNNDDDNTLHIHVELVGEIRNRHDGNAEFSSGIANYPFMGAVAHRIRSRDLAVIYAETSEKTISIGHLTQDETIPALISVDKLISRHFALVGTTGVGKSSAVTLLLRKIIAERPDIRVLILDPHNEFATAFPEEAVTVDPGTLDLPFWLFKLEEFAEAVFRGRPVIAAEIDLLRDLIPQAKELYRRSETGRGSVMVKRDVTSITADTPLPYRMPDLLAIMDERIGQLDGKAERPVLKSLRNRLESLINDPRYRFMFAGPTVTDAMHHAIAHIFRVPQNGRPICAFQLAGLPSEVVNSVASVLCRMAFDLAVSSNGAIQTLVVCEEAHRYIPADPNGGFWPTRAAISRIAKEGRKYGVYLSVVTQRPGELDPTILSQCNTIFAMRLGNERDQEIIRGAITGASKSMTSFLSSIANREAIAFGEAVSTPMRMMFETIPTASLPGAHLYEQQESIKSGNGAVSLEAVIARMRNLDDELDAGQSFATFPATNGTYTPQEAALVQPQMATPTLRRAQSGGDDMPPLARPRPEPDWRAPAINAEPVSSRPAYEERLSPAGMSDLIRSFRNERS